MAKFQPQSEKLFEELQVWWKRKYKLPDDSPLLQIICLEDLIIEWWEDFFSREMGSVKE